MSEVLSKLYYGKIKPCSSNEWETEEYKTHKMKFLELEKKLTPLLSTEATEIFLQYAEHSDSLARLYSENIFKEGFVLGGKIFAEVLTRKEAED